MFDKGNIGLKHEHDTIGRIVSESEFRGFMMAQDQTRSRQIEEMREDLHELKILIDKLHKDAQATHAAHDKRITDLELAKAGAKGYILGVSTVIGLGSSLLILWVSKTFFSG